MQIRTQLKMLAIYISMHINVRCTVCARKTCNQTFLGAQRYYFSRNVKSQRKSFLNFFFILRIINLEF